MKGKSGISMKNMVKAADIYKAVQSALGYQELDEDDTDDDFQKDISTRESKDIEVKRVRIRGVC